MSFEFAKQYVKVKEKGLTHFESSCLFNFLDMQCPDL